MSSFGNFSPQWIEYMFRLWQKEPESVDAEWRAFFEGFELAGGEVEGKICLDPRMAAKQSAVHSLIHRYRAMGHLLACTDPLSPCKISHPLLEISCFGLQPSDLDTLFHVNCRLAPGFSGCRENPYGGPGTGHAAALREIVKALRETYCSSVGVEFMHIGDPEKREWLVERMEPKRNQPEIRTEERLEILGRLREAAWFELFLNSKFLGQTRFSLEGGEVLIPQLHCLVEESVRRGISDLILGMPHRGRLTVLANVFRRPLENIFAEFKDNAEYGVVGEGDVKYHRGFSIDLELPGEGRIHLTMATNPSHLEAIDPVVEGKCRARQDRYGRGSAPKVLPVLIHGDAAFSGQGVVAETFNLSQLSGYRTGGTIHIVLNNQIGFTTVAADARSSLYATDVAKMVEAPIFHVHGEDPEAVVHATRLALEYRQTFAGDVVIEVICYRRHGHNEGDEPYFTQPVMYGKIKNRPPLHIIYEERLKGIGVSEELLAVPASAYQEMLETGLAKDASALDRGFNGGWSSIRQEFAPYEEETGVAEDLLTSLSDALSMIPEGFRPHPKVAALFSRRKGAVANGEGIDWGTAESLAFASLLNEGVPVRLSGEDVIRGTFSQRHGIIYDIESEKPYCPYSGVGKNGAELQIYNSMLSENAVLGFEYGYSMENPQALVIWEAQYGDFANGAQVVIDEFVISSEAKWNRASGLALLLPHGMEGQGPDHSSARPERLLQLCAGNNVQIAFPTTPAQYFHLLRRQVKQPFRKPLVVLTPKGMLRHPLCVSGLSDLTNGRFLEIIAGSGDPARIRSVLICTGKIYFELLERKVEDARDEVALVRVEQLYPLRTDLLLEALGVYGDGTCFAWVQEEPANMGGWDFIRPYLADILGREPRYVGRQAAASPAAGSHRLHKEEQQKLIEEAFGLTKS